MGAESSSGRHHTHRNHQCCNYQNAYAANQMGTANNTCSQQYYTSGYVAYNHNNVAPSATNTEQPVYKEYFVSTDNLNNPTRTNEGMQENVVPNVNATSPEANAQGSVNVPDATTQQETKTVTKTEKEVNTQSINDLSQTKIEKTIQTEKTNTKSVANTSETADKKENVTSVKKETMEKTNEEKNNKSKSGTAAATTKTASSSQTLSSSHEECTTNNTTNATSNDECICDESIEYSGYATTFYNAIALRRTHYDLTEDIPLSRTQVTDLIKKIVRICPTAFNVQSSRIVILYSYAHLRVWHIVKNALKKATTEVQYKESEKKINGCFASGVGTILFYEDSDAIRQQQEQYPAYSANFPIWSQQSSAIAQFAVWTALAQEGIGASLQHYNELIADDLRKVFDIPSSWALIAQMPFGGYKKNPPPKTFIRDHGRFLVGDQ